MDLQQGDVLRNDGVHPVNAGGKKGIAVKQKVLTSTVRSCGGSTKRARKTLVRSSGFRSHDPAARARIRRWKTAVQHPAQGIKLDATLERRCGEVSLPIKELMGGLFNPQNKR
ncbi:MAG: hypothetical protein HYY97_09695 [Rhodocyclales bacterium]|nr:hypothetical protein [Rhodocyclales bacterium]